MKLLYLDCFAGISGDMLLGTLIDLGASEDLLRKELTKLTLPHYSIATRRVVKQSIAATKFDCIEEHQHHHEHRGFTEIAALITSSALAETVKHRAVSVFRRLGEAEAKIHSVPLEQIHFHEIGAVDSIVDIVGTCLALDLLGITAVHASPLPCGSGFIETAHGRFPVPAPATLELLRGVPIIAAAVSVELVTPTGAALLAEFCDQYGSLPPLIVEKIGYGAGTRDLADRPNVLRGVLGQPAKSAVVGDTVATVEANIDDMNPEFFGDVMDRLLTTGALDVFWTSVQMKKNRPGTLLTVLCEVTDVDRVADLILAHTTSFGVRIQEVRRRKLDREIVTVRIPAGEIAVKIGRLHGKVVQRSPEFESCRRIAATANIPVKEVYNDAARAAGDIQ